MPKLRFGYRPRDVQTVQLLAKRTNKQLLVDAAIRATLIGLAIFLINMFIHNNVGWQSALIGGLTALMFGSIVFYLMNHFERANIRRKIG